MNDITKSVLYAKVQERQKDLAPESKIKKYHEQNVFDAAKERLNFVFDNFKYICVSFSGGKDSGVLLNMAIDIARERGRKIGVMCIDIEANYDKTIEFMHRMIDNNLDVLDPQWVCLPMNTDNEGSYYETEWSWWDPDKKDYWVKPMPTDSYVINLDNYKESAYANFYKYKMPFEEFVKYFGESYGRKCAKEEGRELGKDETCVLVGIKTDESLNRFRAIVNQQKEKFGDKIYTTRVNDYCWNAYPIYDWRVDDIWIYNAKNEKDYNQLYDLMYRAGVSPWKMRVDEPFGAGAKAGLSMFKIIEPETWTKVCSRVSGANMAAIYGSSKMMVGGYNLPKGHTWKTFTKFILTTLPKETAEHYLLKFRKFIRWWKDIGSGMPEEDIKELEKTGAIIRTGQLSTRGAKDKEVIRFNQILDEHPLDGANAILTWRRMCYSILRNDYICTRLNFTITVDLTAKQQKILEKYEKI